MGSSVTTFICWRIIFVQYRGYQMSVGLTVNILNKIDGEQIINLFIEFNK